MALRSRVNPLALGMMPQIMYARLVTRSVCAPNTGVFTDDSVIVLQRAHLYAISVARYQERTFTGTCWESFAIVQSHLGQQAHPSRVGQIGHLRLGLQTT
jgi:hypothetical protein